jgi:hypothetical protein
MLISFYVLASKPINTGLDPLEKQFIIIDFVNKNTQS